MVSTTQIQSSGDARTCLRTDQAKRRMARFMVMSSNFPIALDMDETEGEKQTKRTKRDKEGIPHKVMAMSKQSMEYEIPVSRKIS